MTRRNWRLLPPIPDAPLNCGFASPRRRTRIGTTLILTAALVSANCSTAQVREAFDRFSKMRGMVETLPADQKSNVEELIKCYEGYEDLIARYEKNPERYTKPKEGYALLREAEKRTIFGTCLAAVKKFMHDPRSPSLIERTKKDPTIIREAIKGRKISVGDVSYYLGLAQNELQKPETITKVETAIRTVEVAHTTIEVADRRKKKSIIKLKIIIPRTRIRT
ncbi:hypothetical protein HZC07_02315 [Candidatus Micrarchaeota archaeon]|nr:hypothetical protein [Candidatus Micrarchaeota archaeon]